MGKLQARIIQVIQVLQKFVDRVWYPPLVGILAAFDNFLVVIPNDGILISSSMLTPRRWFVLALNVAIGSTIGAVALAAFVETKGLEWILEFYPGINQAEYWIQVESFFKQYGLLLVFIVSATPLMQQPAIIIASLAGAPLVPLAISIFVGRFLKFLLMAYIGSHAPKLISKMWGMRGELKDVGIGN